nr:PREDICTED: uncharacterized protein LOC106705765 isoform X2 [Latimeria chalumnae]|eukprot:XP_014351207.1 PREDICTED: uncharacterized protein LOC106705765 isoform X2 [Latimeria chalumnae]
MSLIIRGNALYRKILYEVYVSNRLLKLLQKQKEKQSEHYVGRVLYSNQSEEVKCCTPLKCFSKNTVLFANNILHQRMWLHRGLHWRINITDKKEYLNTVPVVGLSVEVLPPEG